MEFQESCSPGRAKFVIYSLVLAVSFTSENARAQSTYLCDPPASVKAALDQLPQYRHDPALTDWQVYEQRLSTLETLLRRYPNDVFVEQAYIRSAATPRQVDQASVDQKNKVKTEYKSRHEQNPSSAELDYLYGLTLVGHQTSDAIKLFDTALEKDSSFALPHYELATIYASPAFLDGERRASSPEGVSQRLSCLPAGLPRDRWIGRQGPSQDLRRQTARPFAKPRRCRCGAGVPDSLGARVQGASPIGI